MHSNESKDVIKLESESLTRDLNTMRMVGELLAHERDHMKALITIEQKLLDLMDRVDRLERR